MRWATPLLVAAVLTVASSGGALAQMAFRSTNSAPREVLIEVPNSADRQMVNALLRRHRLTGLEAHRSQLAGTTVYRGRIRGRRSLANVVRSLKAEAGVASAQPNYVYRQTKTAARKRSRQH